MSNDAELSQYLQEATGWDADRVRQADHQRRVAYGIAGVLALCAVASTAAVITLTPLKSVEPFLIRVDNASGSVDVVPRYDGGAPLSEAVTRYLLTHYVTTCERFLAATAEQDYSECGAFHSPQRNQQWATTWMLSNPESPLNRFRDGTTVQVDIQSVSFFERASGLTDLAQVRYTKATRVGGVGIESTTHWIATIQYAYVKPATDPRLRRWNPLGFRVVAFRPEPEVMNSATASATGADVTAERGGVGAR
jgi:type IV secretion system protein VirB8